MTLKIPGPSTTTDQSLNEIPSLSNKEFSWYWADTNYTEYCIVSGGFLPFDLNTNRGTYYMYQWLTPVRNIIIDQPMYGISSLSKKRYWVGTNFTEYCTASSDLWLFHMKINWSPFLPITNPHTCMEYHCDQVSGQQVVYRPIYRHTDRQTDRCKSNTPLFFERGIGIWYILIPNLIVWKYINS